MSSDPRRDFAGEIAYVKTLAEEGRTAPLIGGVLYVIWGGVIAAAALLTYLRMIDVVKIAFVGDLGFWIAALAIGWAASFLVGRKNGLKPGAMTIGNRTATAAWFAVGAYVSLFWIAALLFRGHFKAVGIETGVIFGMIFPIAFGLYGIAFYATATAARLDWMRGFALAAWIFSFASLYYISDARHFLVGAAGSLVCAVLPGLILMRREPSEIV
ncbi:MAG: hypothetical protein A3E78_14980 [Alphaproteobacteria bacterium RIFCSPHIGHO2_12_FULL_63_12]|nr:MAG: hypothetical protein A3E78_14980 [Alphaproteobacteria bacterium RIFCSPHIGHO2_12_FULL_63_12]